MELKGERLIPASVDTTWAALNNPDILKACITGCESLERDGEGGMVALVAVRVGPVSARFKGKLKLSDVVAPVNVTMTYLGMLDRAPDASGFTYWASQARRGALVNLITGFQRSAEYRNRVT